MAGVFRRRNRWVVDFRDASGKRRWESYRTRKQADAALAKRVAQLDRGTYHAPAETPTFREIAEGWLATKQEHRVSSYAQWQVHIEKHLVPALGDLRLDQIRVKHLEKFRDDCRKSGLAPATVNKLLTTAAAIFKHAAKHELTERNPAAVVDRCRLNAGEVSVDSDMPHHDNRGAVSPDEVLSVEQSARLIEDAEPGIYRVYLLTALSTGARVGELTALTWGDVDLDAGAIAVRRSLTWARRRGEKGKPRARFYEPKTRHSRRTIKIAPELVSELKRWKLQCPPGALNLVFPTPAGTPKHRSTIAHEGLQPALRAAGLPRVTVHSLRHTFASALIMNGRPVTEVANLLGHSSPAVTMKIYAHWFKDADSTALTDLTRAVLGGSSLVAAGSTGPRAVR